MKSFKLYALSLIALLSFSCKDSPTNGEKPIIDGTCEVEISSTQFEFDNKENSGIITLDTDFWWINEGIKIRKDTTSYYCWEKDSCVTINRMDGKQNVITEIVGDWFSIIKTSGNSLSVNVTRNDEGIERGFSFGIQSGNCYWNASVTQHPE